MAEDIANPIAYYLMLANAHKDDLGNIRGWNNLKVAFEDDIIWVSGFDEDQITSIAIKSIPFKSLFYQKGGKLFFLESLLPERTIPSLLWSPIARALPVALPNFNHNFFGVKDKVEMRLVKSEKVYESTAIVTSIAVLEQYINTAPTIRLKKLTWALLDNNEVIVVGKPLLPIRGNAYYKRGSFIIPAGYDFDLELMEKTLSEIINPNEDKWIVWNLDDSYFTIAKEEVQLLTISSFRKTVNRFSSF